jgi:hypothetical protein
MIFYYAICLKKIHSTSLFKKNPAVWKTNDRNDRECVFNGKNDREVIFPSTSACQIDTTEGTVRHRNRTVDVCVNRKDPY